MELEIRNVAKIEHAKLKLDGITVIAGENNTGKSTIGKLVFALFNSLHDIGGKVVRDRRNKLATIFEESIGQFLFNDDIIFFEVDEDYFNDIAYDKLLKCDYHDRESVVNAIHGILAGIYEMEEIRVKPDELQEQAEEMVDQIIEVLSITDEQIRNIKVSEYYAQVFHSQINSIIEGVDREAAITAKIKGKKINLRFQNNRCQQVESNIKLLNTASYIDNPFVLDQIQQNRGYGNVMTRDLVRKLRIRQSDNMDSNSYDDAIIQNRLEVVNQIVTSVVHGSFVRDNTAQGGFLEEGNEIPTQISNISTGLKSFLILKRLIENKRLKQKDVVVLDEPEIHLHPQWQLLYAKLIVELQRAFDLNVIITTHSPYFLAAIEKYTKGRADVNYYLSEIKHNVTAFTMVNECIYKVYDLLSQPFEEVCDEEN